MIFHLKKEKVIKRRWNIVKINKKDKVNKGCSTTRWQNFENVKRENNGLFHYTNHPRIYVSSKFNLIYTMVIFRINKKTQKFTRLDFSF